MNFSGQPVDEPRSETAEQRIKFALYLRWGILLASTSTLPTAISACREDARSTLPVFDGGRDTGADDAMVNGDATLDRGLDSPTSDATSEVRVGLSDVEVDASEAPRSDADANANGDESRVNDASADIPGDGREAPDDAVTETTVDAADAADADARFDAEAGVTTDAIVGALGPDCLSCAATNQCFGGQMVCEAFGSQVADAGPAAGQTRQQLCLDTLSCIVATNCAADVPSVEPCYCAACITSTGPGECRATEERGLETTVPSVVLNAFNDLTLGAGMANSIVQCLLDSNCPCFSAGGTSDGGGDGGLALDGGQ
jgi:hypothetical protein